MLRLWAWSAAGVRHRALRWGRVSRGLDRTPAPHGWL